VAAFAPTPKRCRLPGKRCRFEQSTTNGARNTEVLKNKDSPHRISLMKAQPMLKCGKKYVVIDGAATACTYEEK
jgi:hypothetical protein